jgi:N-acetylglucosaminyldiphosphoundecaprenol N-acetyl-beta-D-mannosaminyltransferase
MESLKSGCFTDMNDCPGSEKSSRVGLLNAEVDNISMEELVENFEEGMLLTLHVDMIMKLQKDREFYNILPEFDVITCDSQILYLAAKFLGTPVKERVSGSDFFPKYYMRHKENEAVKIFLCGGMPGVADIAQRKVNSKVGREIIVGTYSPSFDFDTSQTEIDEMIERINQSGATVLLVGLGGARQEKFLIKYRDRFEHVKTFLPLGGTIDYEAETLKRPPGWVTGLGLEWLYRLLTEPRQRWHRYLVHQPPVLFLLLKQRLGLYKDPFKQL